MNVQIITIGDELLIGQIIDTNSAWMAQQLNLIGALVTRIYSVGDDEAAITKVLTVSLEEADVVLLTGGLGPTKDDITINTLANFFDVDLVFHQPTYDRIVALFRKFGRSTTEAHREQCFLPANAVLLQNRMGTAPGMLFNREGQVIISMPGIPYEMKSLMELEVIPRLKSMFPGRPIAHRTILTVGEGESSIAEKIKSIESTLAPGMKLAYLPNLGQVYLRLTAIGEDQQLIERLLDEKVKEIQSLITDLVFGYEGEKLEVVIGNLLRAKRLTVATAESCTGGLLAHKITAVPGASDYFKGSVIAYSNEVKIKQLQVSPATLQQFGAVSKATVEEMVRGALQLFGTDMAIAISGIAGPGGGTPEKPVGLIWLAIGDSERIVTQRLQLWKDRSKNIEYTAVQGLNMIRKFALYH